MKKLVALLLSAVLILGLAACSSGNSGNTGNGGTGNNDSRNEGNGDNKQTASEGKHIVTDHAGNQVEVPNDIKRIVVADIYPMASVLTVFFDSAEKIVGMAPPCMSAAKNGLLGELYPEILNAKTDFIDGIM